MAQKQIILLTFIVLLCGINAYAQTTGIVAYGEELDATPRFRIWNGNTWGSEGFALLLGVDTEEDPLWFRIVSNHKRNEFILGTQDKANDTNVQIYNYSSGTWSNLLELTSSLADDKTRAFDIAIEDLSGDALIVYEKNSTNTTPIDIFYRTWNGTAYSSEQTLNIQGEYGTGAFIRLYKKKGTDDMMLVVSNQSYSGTLVKYFAIPWNGTSFETSKNLTQIADIISAGGIYRSEFSWESLSGEGFFIYMNASISPNALQHKKYNPSCPASICWDLTPTNITTGDSVANIRLCPDKNSDHIGIIYNNAAATAQTGTRMWNGSQILIDSPGDAADIEDTITGALDCAWYNTSSTLFGFINRSTLNTLLYFNFTKTNIWGVSDLDNAPNYTIPGATPVINQVKFVENPLLNQIMYFTADSGRNLRSALWNQTSFRTVNLNPLQVNTLEVSDSSKEIFDFAWNEYDQLPNLTLITPTVGQEFAASATINVTANATDDNAVDKVNISIILPNSTTRTYNLTLVTGTTNYEINFTETTLEGTYNFSITANDTSTHQNNKTISGNFTITASPDSEPSAGGGGAATHTTSNTTLFEIYPKNLSAKCVTWTFNAPQCSIQITTTTPITQTNTSKAEIQIENAAKTRATITYTAPKNTLYTKENLILTINNAQTPATFTIINFAAGIKIATLTIPFTILLIAILFIAALIKKTT